MCTLAIAAFPPAADSSGAVLLAGLDDRTQDGAREVMESNTAARDEIAVR